MTISHHPSDRSADSGRFYQLLDRMAERVGGARTLAACHGRMAWPRRGVYIFFEAGEERSGSGTGRRAVRIGTHALTPGAGTTLWNRLSQHRGSARNGTGNHRGSIFRLLVGAALARRGDCPLPPSWGIDGDTGAAARRLGLEREAVKAGEADLERRVSHHIGAMPLLWLAIDDEPGPESLRGLIERNAIALLSHAAAPAADTPSDGWLGTFSDREPVRRSGLWNNKHVEESYDPAFLDVMERLVEAWQA